MEGRASLLFEVMPNFWEVNQIDDESLPSNN